MIRDYVAPLTILIACFFVLNGTMLNHDTSWYLISTGWWLDGVAIYDKLLELNPPWAFYLAVPPVWVAKTFEASSTTAFQVYTLLIAAVSLAMSVHILKQSTQVSDALRRFIIALAAVGLVFLPLKDFGEREHLFAVFFLPYVFMNMCDLDLSRRERFWISLWATFGIALKHFFVLLPLLVLIWQMISERSLRRIARIEVLLPSILLIGYVVGSWILHPAYFNKVIPLTVAVYGTSSQPLDVILLVALPTLAFLVVCFVMARLIRPARTSDTVILLTALGGALVFVVQSKGWTYHLVPAQVFTFLALGWIGFGLAETRQNKLIGVVSLGMIAAMVMPTVSHGTYQNGLYKQAETYFTCPRGKRTMQVYSSMVSTGFPLANYAEATPANRAPTLWLFPGAVYHLKHAADAQTQVKYTEILDFARNEVVNDFLRVRPQVVIVDAAKDKRYFKGASFDYLAHFTQDAQYSAAWEAYEQVGQIGNFEIYRRPGC